MDLALLQLALRQFAAEREWEPFHTPKNLAMALMIEAAELAATFQWMTPEQSQAAHQDKVVQGQVADAVAGVLLYLLQLADHSAIDLKRAVGRKLVKNAKKHPPTKPGVPSGIAGLLDDQSHVLVDWENVQPKDAHIRNLVPDVTNLWIFHGPNQKKVDAHQKSFGDNLTLIPITRSGKNALDFHLTFYMGYIASRHPQARFVVISNDQGYGPLLEHARDLGFAAAQVGFGKVTATSRVPVAKKVVPIAAPPAKKVAPAKTVATKKAPKVKQQGATAGVASPTAPRKVVSKAAAKRVVPTKSGPAGGATTRKSNAAGATDTSSAKTAQVKKELSTANTSRVEPIDQEKAYAHVVASLKKAKNQPTRRARLNGVVKSLLVGGQADAEAVEKVVRRLVTDGHASIDAKGAVTLNH